MNKFIKLKNTNRINMKMLFMLLISPMLMQPTFSQSMPSKADIINWIKEKTILYSEIKEDKSGVWHQVKINENGDIEEIDKAYDETGKVFAENKKITSFDNICFAQKSEYVNLDGFIEIKLKIPTISIFHCYYPESIKSSNSDTFYLALRNIEDNIDIRMIKAINDLGKYNCPKGLY